MRDAMSTPLAFNGSSWSCTPGVSITPGATAFLWARRFRPMLGIAALVGTGSALIGVYAAFWIDSAPAPTIVLVMTAAFAASLARVAWRDRSARRQA